jgi:hypothetical protein
MIREFVDVGPFAGCVYFTLMGPLLGRPTCQHRNDEL